MSDVAGRMARLSFRVDLTLPVLSQPLGKQLDGGEEVVVEAHQQVDVVGVVAAAKTVRQIVSWVHGGAKLAADGTEEAEVALIVLRGRTVTCIDRSLRMARSSWSVIISGCLKRLRG